MEQQLKAEILDYVDSCRHKDCPFVLINYQELCNIVNSYNQNKFSKGLNSILKK